MIVIAEDGVSAEGCRDCRQLARKLACVLGAKTDEIATKKKDVRIEPRQLLQCVVDGLLRRARTGMEVSGELDAQRTCGADRSRNGDLVLLHRHVD